MPTPSAPLSFHRLDLVIDHPLWERLKSEAQRRDCDLGAMVSLMLMQQVHRP